MSSVASSKVCQLNFDTWIVDKLENENTSPISKTYPALNYEIPSAKESADMIDAIKQDLSEGKMRVSGSNDNTVWEKGWGEVYQNVTQHGVNKQQLNPQYFGKYDYLRLDGQFIKPLTEGFEAQLDLWIREYIFSRYLKGQNRIVELGCGTGNSLLLLNQLFPNAELVGADWASASQKIVNAIAHKTAANIIGVNLNMLTLQGFDELQITYDSAVISVHALEQLGDNYRDLTDALIKSTPKLCVHLEPVIENYTSDNDFDQLAQEYHTKRNYLGPWLTYLQQKESTGEIRILENKRLGFGGVYHEAYSLVVWQSVFK
ncbi:class I SAM-dependent methyltransferase [Catenovulum maritimum]|uniref:Methyltransferase domain-containing protein n=1 Tax=Catenovulum maritimum TaxID=1513271 RepID=A0A0J8GV38_9ALTE|nr:class I SAM-dependent methyltransferase [Catenovulum maritimum]KMT66597.1 hypothetical protein XM47_03435 [Catenovulum maritimum]